MNNLEMEKKRFLILVYIQKSQVMMFFDVIPLSKTETWQEHGKVHFSDLIDMISTYITDTKWKMVHWN